MKYEIFKEYPDVITIEELMQMLRIGQNVAYDMLKTKTIKADRYGNRYIIPKQSVINYINNIC